MRLELITTDDLKEMEDRIIAKMSQILNDKSQSEDNVLTLSVLREKYKINQKALSDMITCKKINPVTHSDLPGAKRYFKESEIKLFFSPVAS